MNSAACADEPVAVALLTLPLIDNLRDRPCCQLRPTLIHKHLKAISIALPQLGQRLDLICASRLLQR